MSDTGSQFGSSVATVNVAVEKAQSSFTLQMNQADERKDAADSRLRTAQAAVDSVFAERVNHVPRMSKDAGGTLAVRPFCRDVGSASCLSFLRVPEAAGCDLAADASTGGVVSFGGMQRSS